jgi:hypothetical protein
VTRHRHPVLVLVAGAVGAVTIAAALAVNAACSSPAPAIGQSPPAPAASSAAAPADPVAILRATGATVPPGTAYGDHDIYGDRMASGQFPGLEQVTVYTAADHDAYEEIIARATVDDFDGLIVIPAKLAVIETTGVFDAQTNAEEWGGPAPAQIARLTGGRVIPPGSALVPGTT